MPPRIPNWMLQNADEQGGLVDYLGQSGYPLGEMRPQVQESPGAKLGPLRFSGSGLDSAALAVLQSLQNSPRPQGFGQSFAAGLAGGLAGGRARQYQQRTQANQKSAEDTAAMAKERRGAAAKYLADYRHDQRRTAMEQMKQENKPAAAGRERFRLTPAEAKAMGAGYDTETEYASTIKNEAMQRVRPKEPSSIDAGFDPNSVAGGIVGGTLAAHPSGYARGQWGKIATSLRKQSPGFNLAKAQMYWSATQRMLSTVNGTRFSLMYNASNTLDDQLELMDQASSTLESLIPRSRWDSLNRLSVDKIAREMGVHGQEIKDAAQAYYTQAALMQSELAQVFQAGGVPTEEAMKMAQKALPLDANYATIHRLINNKDGIVRLDLRLRQNAIRTFSPIVPGQNPYWESDDGEGDTPGSTPGEEKPALAPSKNMGQSFLDSLAAQPKRRK